MRDSDRLIKTFCDGVQVSGEHKRVRALFRSEQVPVGISTGHETQGGEACDQVLSHRLLFAGWAVHLHNVAERCNKPVFVDHLRHQLAGGMGLVGRLQEPKGKYTPEFGLIEDKVINSAIGFLASNKTVAGRDVSIAHVDPG